MELTFGTGLFWLLLAWIAGVTIEQTVRAWRGRGRPPSADAAALARRVAELEALTARLEGRLAEQAAAGEAHETTLARLEERAEFVHRLLTGEQAHERAGPGGTARG